jgi:hypothetical protein
MAQWLGRRLFAHPMQVLCDAQSIPQNEIVLNYGEQSLAQKNYQIVPHGLLHQNGIVVQAPEVSNEQGFPVFFKSEKGHHAFDVLAASFYLISRYEEYYPGFEKDEYNRYSHANGMAHAHGFLKRPLVDEWIEDLKEKLKETFPTIEFVKSEPGFVPTYDVDVAWSYRNKGLLRNAGGLLKEMAAGKWRESINRCKVLLGLKQDPFDIFVELQQTHKQCQWKPLFFFLLAENYQGYDKNIDRRNERLQQLMRWLQDDATTGIHLSWAASQNATTMQDEKSFMEKVLEAPVTSNRMHYVNFRMPKTFQQLIALGITKDYSMGYGTVNGFRASTSHPYFWYDVKKEETTSLQIFPFAWMDANSIFEQKDTPEQALHELQMMYEATQKTGGTFISICHNHLMGRDEAGRKWWGVYEQFLQRNFEAYRGTEHME